jgi:hypothetical protein
MRNLTRYACLAILCAACLVSNVQAQGYLKRRASTIEEVWWAVSDHQEYLLKNPAGSASSVRQALDSICRKIREVDGPTGLKILAGLRKPEAKGNDYLDEAHAEVAKKLVVENKLEDCAEILEVMRRDYHSPAARCETMLVAAQLAAARGETKAEKESLDGCLAVDAPDSSSRDSARIWSAKNEAVVRAALWHEKQGNFVQAYHFHKAHKFTGGCGISACFFDDGRLECLSRCFAAIPDHRVAVRLCLDDAMSDSGEVARKFLFSLYRDAGQIDDLTRIVGELEQCDAEQKRASANENRPRDSVSSMLRVSIACESMRQQGNVNGLVARFADGREIKGLHEQVAAMLAECSGDTASAFLSLLVAASPTERNVLLTSLADEGSSKSLRIMIQFADSEASCDFEYIPFKDTDVLLAQYIAEGGAEGVKALSRLAKHSDPKRASASRVQLSILRQSGSAKFEEDARKRIAARMLTMSRQRKPAQGSLPKSLTEALAIEVPRSK